MSDRNHLRTLIDYNAWANKVCFESVLDLPPEEVTKERHSFLKTILLSLNHLLVIDMVWLAHMKKEPHEFTALQTLLYEDLDELWTHRQEMDETLKSYLDGLSEEEIEEVVDYELIGGNKGSMSRAMIFSHLALHGNYHRGWIAGMYGQIPRLPLPTDLPVYERALRENS